MKLKLIAWWLSDTIVVHYHCKTYSHREWCSERGAYSRTANDDNERPMHAARCNGHAIAVYTFSSRVLHRATPGRNARRWGHDGTRYLQICIQQMLVI